MRWGRALPVLLLMVLSFTIAEFLTGSTYFPTVFTDPLALPFLFGLYGCGVLLVREASIRWKNGWVSIMFLGFAYGIAEEGFGTKTFFAVNSSVVGFYTTYGRALDVNWVWVVMLTLFHAIFSIALPIVLLGLLLPSTRGRPLVQDGSLTYFVLAFLATVVVLFLLTSSENPPWPVLAGFLAIATVFVVAAWRIPPEGLNRWLPRSGPDPRRMLIVGAAFVWGFFFVNWVASRFLPYPVVLIGIVLVWTGISAWTILAEFRGPARPYVRWMLATGLLSFLLFLSAVFVGLGAYGTLVPLAAVIGMLGYLYRRTRPESALVPLEAIPV